WRQSFGQRSGATSVTCPGPLKMLSPLAFLYTVPWPSGALKISVAPFTVAVFAGCCGSSVVGTPCPGRGTCPALGAGAGGRGLFGVRHWSGPRRLRPESRVVPVAALPGSSITWPTYLPFEPVSQFMVKSTARPLMPPLTVPCIWVPLSLEAVAGPEAVGPIEVNWTAQPL